MSGIDRMTCTGAILMGGMSSRMGSPKHELKLPNGSTMLEQINDVLNSVCSRVVFVGGAKSESESESTIIGDMRPHAGPLGGIEALLASGIDSGYLICPCDLPLIAGDLLRLLLDQTDALCTVFRVEGSDACEPLPMYLRTESLPVVRRLLNAQQRSLWKLVKELAPIEIVISQQQAAQLHNVNTLDDYAEAVRRLRC